ncbi:MAG: glycerol kinase GlpK [Pseudomonadales bacterium]
MSDYILAIDQGTTSSRAILFSLDGTPAAIAQQEFKQYFPDDGWVEHDPEEIWQTTLWACRDVMRQLNCSAQQILSVGITNQRETVVLWERDSGVPVHKAIVWQDRRTHDYCEKLRAQGHEALVQERTGLLLDPYFSASKIRWLLNEVPGLRERANKGELACGTIDSYLIWRLTHGEVHATDATNASRTALFNIHKQQWDPDLLKLFDVPPGLLPEVLDSSASYGSVAAEFFGGSVDINGVAGDQQSAMIGQACFSPGNAKSTYGTGCFLVQNTGTKCLKSRNRLLATVGYRLNGETTYALEGSIFNAGTAVQWLRDGLGVIESAAEVEAIASRTPDTQGVYMVPAFTGLGAPYWDAQARGALHGITRDTSHEHIVTAALQSVAFQTRDLMEAMGKDGQLPAFLRVDGGMAVNNWLLQFLADMLGCHVVRSNNHETTALGAAYLAGLQSGAYSSLDSIAENWAIDREFAPSMPTAQRDELYAGWLRAVDRVRS